MHYCPISFNINGLHTPHNFNFQEHNLGMIIIMLCKKEEPFYERKNQLISLIRIIRLK